MALRAAGGEKREEEKALHLRFALFALCVSSNLPAFPCLVSSPSLSFLYYKIEFSHFVYFHGWIGTQYCTYGTHCPLPDKNQICFFRAALSGVVLYWKFRNIMWWNLFKCYFFNLFFLTFTFPYILSTHALLRNVICLVGTHHCS